MVLYFPSLIRAKPGRFTSTMINYNLCCVLLLSVTDHKRVITHPDFPSISDSPNNGTNKCVLRKNQCYVCACDHNEEMHYFRIFKYSDGSCHIWHRKSYMTRTIRILKSFWWFLSYMIVFSIEFKFSLLYLFYYLIFYIFKSIRHVFYW